MATTRSQTPAQSGTSASAKQAGTANASKTPSQPPQPPQAEAAPRTTPAASASPTRDFTLTIPLGREAVDTAAHAAMVPVTAAKRVLKSRNGLPAYIGIAGLAAVGVVEWPIAAVAGASLAYLRRWGPLRPDSAKPPQVVVQSTAVGKAGTAEASSE